MNILEKKTSTEIKYWNNYYESERAMQKPSSFARYCLSSIDKQNTLVEFGCGNGRDSLYFSRNNIKVIALDRSVVAIKKNELKTPSKVRFLHQDFTSIPDSFAKYKIGTVYSRFTLHSVNKEGYDKALISAYRLLEQNGKFLIEARTVNDPLFGIGKPCPNNGFIHTCLLYTSPSPRDATLSRMPSSA